MDNNFELMEGTPRPPEGLKRFPKLEKLENIALIRVIRERKPSFHCGNQYRDALNVICGVGIAHADGLNAEIMNLALEVTTLPEEIEAEVVRILPFVRMGFDEHLKTWAKKERAGDESKSKAKGGSK